MKLSVNLVILIVLPILALKRHMIFPNIATLTNYDALHSRTANDDIDFLLESFKKQLPARIKAGYIHKRLAYDCYLIGLNKGISRSDDAFLDVNGLKATFTFDLSTSKLTLECKLKRRKTWRKLKAFTGGINVKGKINLELKPLSHPILKEFKVLKVKEISTDVRKLGSKKWIGNYILMKETNGAKSKFTKTMENDIAKKFQNWMKELKLPDM